MGQGSIAIHHLLEPAPGQPHADAHRQHVDQHDSADLAALDRAGEQRCAERDGFVRVHSPRRLAAEEGADLLPHERHAALAADQEQLADVGDLQPAVGQHVVADAQGAVDEALGQLLQLGPGQGGVDVAGLVVHQGDERHVHRAGQALGERDLRPLGRVGDPLVGDPIALELDPVLLLEARQKLLDDRLVEVDAAEEGVASGGDHLVDVPVQLEHRGVERAAAQVVDEHALLEPAPVREGNRGGGRLVHDPLHLQSGQRARRAHRLTLVVVVVGGNGDYRPLHLAAEPLLRDVLHLSQDQRGDLLQRVDLASQLHGCLAARTGGDLVGESTQQIVHHRRLELPPDEALGAVDGVPRVDQHLPAGGMADEQLALVAHRDDGRNRVVALSRGNDERLAVLHHRRAGVGGAQVDPDDGAFSRSRGPGGHHVVDDRGRGGGCGRLRGLAGSERRPWQRRRRGAAGRRRMVARPSRWSGGRG